MRRLPRPPRVPRPPPWRRNRPAAPAARWAGETANGCDGFTPLALASVWEPTLRLGVAAVRAGYRADEGKPQAGSP